MLVLRFGPRLMHNFMLMLACRLSSEMYLAALVTIQAFKDDVSVNCKRLHEDIDHAFKCSCSSIAPRRQRAHNAFLLDRPSHSRPKPLASTSGQDRLPCGNVVKWLGLTVFRLKSLGRGQQLRCREVVSPAFFSTPRCMVPFEPKRPKTFVAAWLELVKRDKRQGRWAC